MALNGMAGIVTPVTWWVFQGLWGWEGGPYYGTETMLVGWGMTPVRSGEG